MKSTFSMCDVGMYNVHRRSVIGTFLIAVNTFFQPNLKRFKRCIHAGDKTQLMKLTRYMIIFFLIYFI